MKLGPIIACMLLFTEGHAGAAVLQAGGGFGAAPLEHCATDLRYLNTVSGWQVIWPYEWRLIDNQSADEQRAAIAGWMDAPEALERDKAKLQKGLRLGQEAPRSVVLRVLDQIGQFELELDHGSFASGLWQTDPARRALVARTLPAVRTYRDWLRSTYLPRAASNAGLPQTPEGRRCFEHAVKEWTGLDERPARIEDIGRRILSDTKRDLVKEAGIEPAQVPALLSRLRKGDPKGKVTADEIVRVSVDALARAREALPGWFVDIPNASIEVREMPPAMAANAPAGVYGEVRAGRPVALYQVNTSRPGERRLMAEVVAFHEGIPGHHLQTIAGPKSDAYNAGFGEGWAIYAEYLADEMGLYSGQRDREGMMAKHLWAASRLIVEPGLHLHGWSRERAIRFMLDNTALSRSEIEIEVDRYSSMPGQSLSYMLGYDRFRRMRAHAKATLGPRFSMLCFHKVLLAAGMRNLKSVDADVERWIGAQQQLSPLAAESCAAPVPGKAAGLALQAVALDRRWARAVELGRRSDLEGIFADDLQVVSGSGVLRDKAAEIADEVRPGGEIPDFFRSEVISARAEGGVAILVGTLRWRLKGAGAPVDFERRYTALYAQRPGGLRLVHLQISGPVPREPASIAVPGHGSKEGR